MKDIKIYYPEGVNPTRKNVLDNKKVKIISGGTNYYPFSPENDTIEDLDQLLRQFDDSEDYYQVSLRLIIEIFSHITSESDFRIKAFVSIMRMGGRFLDSCARLMSPKAYVTLLHPEHGKMLVRDWSIE